MVCRTKVNLLSQILDLFHKLHTNDLENDLEDDIENDVNAAQKIGGRGVLIYTGKTKYSANESFRHKPDVEIHSLNEMIDVLDKINY